MKHLTILFFLISCSYVFAQNECSKIIELTNKGKPNSHKTSNIIVDGVEFSQVSDSDHSTGATLFFFREGALASFDARGGSVASAETSLLEKGSYSSEIDGVVFAGGSTMGLEASAGVREVLFQERANSEAFDFIPSIPSAVVYDYGGRLGANSSTAYPTREYGHALMAALSENKFVNGRAGAGVTTTVNKMRAPIWGGQGIAYKKYEWGSVAAAVVINAAGDIYKNGKLFKVNNSVKRKVPNASGQNTTLSIVMTDVDLTKEQLDRLSITTHTSMARTIHPFHTYTDGDINFAISTQKIQPPKQYREIIEYMIQQASAELMTKAIFNAIKAANKK